MGARWYNPLTGRFLTKDSYPPDLLAPLTQNPYQYCANNPIGYVDSTGELAFPGQIHNLVVNHVYNKYKDTMSMHMERTIDFRFGWGRADLISDSGAIWDVKRDKPRQIASGVAQVSNYVRNTWRDHPLKTLSVGGYLPPDSFVATIGVDTYYISYHYVEGGIIAYDYYTVTDWQKVGEIATGVVMIAGAAFVIYVTGGAAAPVLIPLLAP
jgi:hypothetical protein